MKFCIINPTELTAKMVDVEDFHAALKVAGLKQGQIDFGALSRYLHIAVYEFGLYLPLDQQKYFSLGRNLYIGNAVFFGSDDHGETINLPRLPPVMFYRDADAVERAIQRDEIDRPIVSVNGAVLWQWPQPRVM
jgi:hypothetical protein